MSKAVQISEAASIGIHAMVIIACGSSFINVNEIARQTGASKNHIAKVMQTLSKGGLVKSVRGPAGGFQLSKDPSEISLLDIYEAIEGKVLMQKCPFDRPVCPFNKCLMAGMVHELSNTFTSYLKGQILSDYISDK